jgi:2-polyprenyl-6-methoxyphenol hydroxylase-like FAD-dependent oxidoreductase
MIPSSDGCVDPGHRRVNWAIYTSQPAGLDFADPTSVPPGSVSPELYAHLDSRIAKSMPPDIERLIRYSPREEVAIQPVYDEVPVRLSQGRMLLTGDAAAVLRPHTGSGATKALQDALALQSIASECADWDAVFERCDE